MRQDFIMFDFQHVGNGGFGSFGLVGLLRSLGYRSSLIGGPSIADLLQNKDKIIRVLKAENPRCVGLSVFTPYADFVDTVAVLVKEALGDIPVILGGYHATMFGKKALDHFQWIDYLVVGDAEESLPRIIEEVKSGVPTTIAGVYKKTNRAPWTAGPAQTAKSVDYAGKAVLPVQDIPKTPSLLDHIPYPHEDVIHSEYYDPSIISGHASLPLPSRYVLFSRGCPFTCSFCKIDKDGGFRTKMKYYSPKKVIETLGILKDRYALKGVSFIDDNFTLNKKWAYEVCEGMKKNKLKMKWQAQIRADLMDEDLLDAMCDAGCTVATITIESGNDRIRTQVLDKRVSREELRFAYAAARKRGMLIQGTLMIGAPTETTEEMEDSIALLEELDPDWAGIVLTTVIPGTPMWNSREKEIKVSCWGDYEIAIQPELLKRKDIKLDFHHIPHDILLKRFFETKKKYEYYNRGKFRLGNLRSKEHLAWVYREVFGNKNVKFFDKHNLTPVNAR